MKEDIGSFFGIEKGCKICKKSFEDDNVTEMINLHWFDDIQETRFVHKKCIKKLIKQTQQKG